MAGSDVVGSDLTWLWLVARGLHESRQCPVGQIDAMEAASAIACAGRAASRGSPGHPHLLKNSVAKSRLRNTWMGVLSRSVDEQVGENLRQG